MLFQFKAHSNKTLFALKFSASTNTLAYSCRVFNCLLVTLNTNLAVIYTCKNICRQPFLICFIKLYEWQTNKLQAKKFYRIVIASTFFLSRFWGHFEKWTNIVKVLKKWQNKTKIGVEHYFNALQQNGGRCNKTFCLRWWHFLSQRPVCCFPIKYH